MRPCSTTFQERRTPQAFTICAASNGISSPFWRIVPRAMCGLALRLTSVIVIEKLYIVRLPCVSVFKYDILPDIFIISWSKTICTFYNGWCPDLFLFHCSVLHFIVSILDAYIISHPLAPCTGALGVHMTPLYDALL